MKEKSYHVKDLLMSESPDVPESLQESEPEIDEEPEMVEDNVEVREATTNLPIEYMDVDTITIPEIKDLRGRISDIVDVLVEETGSAVIPFEVANISPEVTKLQRHEIFTLDGKSYAMLRVPREDVIEDYTKKIIKTISSGIPFMESLQTQLQHNGILYNTFALSRVEWTLLFSKFRNYRQELKVQDGSNLVLIIYAERAKQ